MGSNKNLDSFPESLNSVLPLKKKTDDITSIVDPLSFIPETNCHGYAGSSRLLKSK